MNFGLAISASGKADEFSNNITELSDVLRNYYVSKNYGNDVKMITIGIVVFEPVYANFFKQKKIKYYAGERSITHDGIPIIVENAIEFEHRIDYDIFINSKNVKKLLAIEILKSLSNLDALPKKVKDFDKERFKSDMAAFFKSEKLI